MATSGSVNTTKGMDSYFRVTWERTAYSIPNNTSTIKWTLYLVSNNYWYTNAVRINSVVINGVTVKGTETYSNKYQQTYTLASGSQTISHNADGTKTFSISVSGWFYEEGTVTGSGNFTLDTIPRYANVTQSLSSKTETTATIAWTTDATVDYIWYSTDNGSNWTGINVADGTSGTYTISGLTANTTYQVKTRVRRKDSQLTKDSSALAVTTYDYPFAIKMPNFTIGAALTIGLYNPLGRTVSVKMIAADNSELGGGSGDTTSGTSITGFNNTGWVNFWYASIPNAQSGTYKVKVTYGSVETTKTGGTYTVNASVCAPAIGTVAYQDINSTVVAITGNNQKIVRNQSTVRYTASGLTAKNSATVSSCSVTVNGNTYNLTLSGSSATGGNASINSGSNVNAVFTVTDSRGLTATMSASVQMLDWSLPSAIITLQRQDNFYSETDITVDADYSYIDGQNSVTITYKAKKVGTSTYTVTGTLQDNVQSTFTADNNYEWDVVVTITDRFGGTTTYTLFLSRGLPIIYFDRLKSSVGINCFPVDFLSLEVNGVNVLPITLFDGTDSNSTITLDDTLANYSYVEIYFRDNNSQDNGFVKIAAPNGKGVNLSLVEATSVGNTIIRRTVYSLSGTAITPDSTKRGYIQIAANGAVTTVSDANYIYITKVLGYR